jgi:hypothetical protein
MRQDDNWIKQVRKLTYIPFEILKVQDDNKLNR